MTRLRKVFFIANAVLVLEFPSGAAKFEGIVTEKGDSG
jgi:hypothetical protein